MNKANENRNVLMINFKLIANDIKYYLELQGFKVKMIESATLTLDIFKREVQKHHPAFVFNLNFSPTIAYCASENNVPYVSWTIDPLTNSRFTLLSKINLPRCLAFVHHKQLIGNFSDLGLVHIHYLPLAAPAHRRKLIDEMDKLADYRCPISFVGVSLHDEAMTSINHFKEMGLGNSHIHSIRNWLEKFYQEVADDHSFRGFAEDTSLVPRWVIDVLPNPAEIEQCAYILDGWISNILRVSRIKAVENTGIAVWGNSHWRPYAKNYKGYAHHEEQLTLIYNGSDINLDMPRVYQRDIVTMRVFDIMASGGLVLSEPSEDLLELFNDGEHLVCYENTAELRSKIDYLVQNPGEIKEIALAGHLEVQKSHLLEQRVDVIINTIRENGWLASESLKRDIH